MNIRIANYSDLVLGVSCIAVTLGLSVPLVPGKAPEAGGTQAVNSRGGSPGRGGWQGGGGDAAAGPLHAKPSAFSRK